MIDFSLMDEMRDLDEYIQISLISEYIFCKRRCSLYLLENTNDSNFFIDKGTVLHQKVNTYKIEKRQDFVIVTSLNIFSRKLNLIGICDKVRFIKDFQGAYIDILKGKYIIEPIEYKSGKVRPDEKEYIYQLCAQAICLEEMYQCEISYGFLYFVEYKEYVKIYFTKEMKRQVVSYICDIFNIVKNSYMYQPIYKKSCKNCRFFEKCQPLETNVDTYLKKMRDVFYNGDG